MQNRQEILSGEVVKTVWKLAWPNIVTSVLSIFNMFTDRFFVGKLGESSLAVVTAVWFFMWLFQSLCIGINVGTIALVSRFAGAGEMKKAEETGRQALWLGMFASLVFIALCLWFADPLLKLIGIAPDQLAQAKQYYYPLVFSALFQYFLYTQLSILRGLGEMMETLKVMLWINLLCVMLDYLLIFGFWIIPPLGLMGAGLAVAISRIIGTGYMFFYYFKPGYFNLYSGSFIPSWNWFMRILKVGFPMVIQYVVDSLSWIVKVGILARTSQATNAVAALGVGITVEGMAYMVAASYAMACATMVGQNLGAKDPQRAEESGWKSALQGTLFMGLIAALFSIFAVPLAGLFAKDPQAIKLITTYLWIMAPSELFLGMAMILSGALEGAGDTWAPAGITVFCAWALRIPLIWYFCVHLNLGATPAWIIISATTVVQGLWIMTRFRSGKWKTAKV